MLVLGIETTTNIFSIALCQEENIIGEIFLNTDGRHANSFFSSIDFLFTATNFTPKDLQGVIVSIGPGNFTGLRLGVAVANTFAQVMGIPIIGIPTLDVLAGGIQSSPDDIICSIIDVRQNKLYAGLYRRAPSGELHKIGSTKLTDIKNLLTDLTKYKSKIIFVGNGIILYKNIIKKKFHSRVIFTEQNFPKASVLCLLGNTHLRKRSKNFIVKPFYIR